MNRLSPRWAVLLGALLMLAVLSPGLAAAGDASYEITVTNITRAQTFTPRLAVAHTSRADVFEPGQPAIPELEIVAEAGGTGPLEALLNTLDDVGGTAVGNGLLMPGESQTFRLSASRYFRRLSLVAMLIPTNDTFVALDSVILPRWGKRTFHARAYDAGTEANDQNCANMPGPRCGGAGSSEPADSDEGYIYISNGFHDLGDSDVEGNEILGPATYDWRNPVARITVRRVHKY